MTTFQLSKVLGQLQSTLYAVVNLTRLVSQFALSVGVEAGRAPGMTRVTKRLSTNSLPAISYLLQHDHGDLDQVEDHIHWFYCSKPRFRATHETTISLGENELWSSANLHRQSLVLETLIF